MGRQSTSGKLEIFTQDHEETTIINCIIINTWIINQDNVWISILTTTISILTTT